MTVISANESKFLWAIRQQESGGNYSEPPNSAGAEGAFQELGSNLVGWEREAGLPVKTGTAFLNDPAYQDQLAIYKLGGYYNKYGPQGAAAMWYSGQPDPSKTYGNPPVSQYVSEVMGRISQAPANGIGYTSGSGGSGTVAGGGTSATPASSLIDPLGALGITSLKDTVERVGLVLIGVAFILVAILRFTDAGQSLVKKAKTGAKVAMVV